MKVGDLVKVYGLSSVDKGFDDDDIGIITHIDYDVKDFSSDLDPHLYTVYLTNQGIERWLTSSNITLLLDKKE